MKVVVTPNSKIPIRGLLSRPFVDEKVLDLTEMQIKRVLGFGAKVHVVSLDGIKGEITLVNGQLNTDAIKNTLESVGEADNPTDSKTAEVAQVPVETEQEAPAEQENNTPANENPYQHMTKAQRRAARRAEAQQKAEESAKEAEETPVETVEESNDVNEDTAKDNAEVIEAEEKVEE